MSEISPEIIIKTLVDIATEKHRFCKVFEKVLMKLDVDEQSRYISQFAWFSKRVDTALKEIGLNVVNFEGHRYDAGMAVVPINIDEFSENDILYIEQMIEPIIMKDEKVIKEGTVILGRVSK